MAEISYQNNFNMTFTNNKSDILIHITQWQYWWWFWFTFLWSLYYLLCIRIIRRRTLKFNPRIASTLRPHGKWGDLLTAFIPVTWCLNILYNSSFILKLIEWQSEFSLLTLRVRGKQWYWVYKFDLRTLTDVFVTPKNIGHNKWQLRAVNDVESSEDYTQILRYRTQNKWVRKYWKDLLDKSSRIKASQSVVPEELYKLDFINSFKKYNESQHILDNSCFFSQKDWYSLVNNSSTNNLNLLLDPSKTFYLNSFLKTYLFKQKSLNVLDIYLTDLQVYDVFFTDILSENKNSYKVVDDLTLSKHAFVQYLNIYRDIYENLINLEIPYQTLNKEYFGFNLLNSQWNVLKIFSNWVNNTNSFEHFNFFQKLVSSLDAGTFTPRVNPSHEFTCFTAFNNQQNHLKLLSISDDKTIYNNLTNTLFLDLYFKNPNNYMHDSFDMNSYIVRCLRYDDCIGSIFDTNLQKRLYNGYYINSNLSNFYERLLHNPIELYNFTKNFGLNLISYKNTFLGKNFIENNNYFSTDLSFTDHVNKQTSILTNNNLFFSESDLLSYFFFKKKPVNSNNIYTNNVKSSELYLNKKKLKFYLSKIKKIKTIKNSTFFLNNKINENKFLNYSDFVEDSRWMKRSIGNNNPFRCIKLPLPDNLSQSSDIDLFRFRFYSHEPKLKHKPEPMTAHLNIKQKRYNPRTRIKPQSFVKDDGKVYSGNPFLKSRTILEENFSEPTKQYKLFKKAKNRSENFKITTWNRLLRTKRILVLPAHVNITVITNSYDVVHSWHIPGLGLKMDCLPGRATHHTLYIDNVGLYFGQCAEICGRYHHHMPIRLCALPFEHFLVWWHCFGLPRLLFMRDDLVNKSYSWKKFSW